MGKRRLFLGVAIGAAAGGLVTLFDKDTRDYTKEKLNAAKSGSTYFIQNPSEAIHNMRNAFDKFNQNFSSGAESAINALEQVEDTLEKVTNKSEPERIE
ncbi:hypothetical protein CIL05_18510 [Virgibacillus profundi]|uniref:YtxH domain-containing protein n=1 Tax=Virgibacillus profundi TaxID=2024555 RepID=A0A2A2I7X5_9BACI|nr:hypothetical protein [Virgibacillus profundi]PAV28101.1 hypothetical protein CIL05_18510 [Virgibacillus profundi]PXY52406.1 hypothetical protein CIT14_17960 [Virgibacillus profundi]